MFRYLPLLGVLVLGVAGYWAATAADARPGKASVSARAPEKKPLASIAMP
jgi:hypothetical protein